MDMRANDHGWLAAEARSAGQDRRRDAFEMPFPPHGERKRMPSVVAAMAQVIQWRVEQLGAFGHEGPTPVLDALFSRKEPKTGTDGTLSWTVDVTTRPPAKTSSSASRKSPCPTASPAPTRCGSPATTRAPSTA
jgi:ribonucleoside-diphosphate reductase alpha chain